MNVIMPLLIVVVIVLVVMVGVMMVVIVLASSGVVMEICLAVITAVGVFTAWPVNRLVLVIQPFGKSGGWLADSSTDSSVGWSIG